MKPVAIHPSDSKMQKVLFSLVFVMLSSLLFALLWVWFIVAAIKVFK